MRNLISLAALALALLPTAVVADTVQNTNTYVGNASYTGSLTAQNLNAQFQSTGGSAGQLDFSTGNSNIYPFTNVLWTNPSLLGAIVNKPINSTGWAALPIYGFAIQCAPYNPVFVTGASGYPYTVETNGIAGGTITFHEYKTIAAAGVVVGTLTLPSSPHGGPYINYASSTLAAPYTPTFGSMFDAQVTTINPGPSQGYQFCVATPILQGSPSPGGNG
jgi:hypothetical protein